MRPRDVVSPIALCRMDAELVRRIARGEALSGVAAGALLAIAIGAGLYGAAFGLWRAPEQALFAAIKLPALFFAVVLATLAINAMIAMLLRAPLGVRQSAVCILVGLATSAVVLGALAPASAFIAYCVRPPDPSLLGLADTDPRAESANAYAQGLLLYHVAVIAVAGVLGNLRLHRLLRELCGKRELALRVLFAWLAIELLVGSELSWIARPFLGRPHTPVSLFVDDPLRGSFFEEIGSAMAAALGVEGTIALFCTLVGLALVVRLLMQPDGMPVEIAVERDLVVTSADARFRLAWSDVVALTLREATVLFADTYELVIDVREGPTRRLLVRLETEEEAATLKERAEAARRRSVGAGPFRSGPFRSGRAAEVSS